MDGRGHEQRHQKFEMMYKLGVRSFAVFFDDIFGEGKRGGHAGAPAQQDQQRIRQGEKGRHPLVMCPTEYNRGWADSSREPTWTFWATVWTPPIQVMWTGDSICHDITLEGQQWVDKGIKRPSLRLVELPVTRTTLNAMHGPRVRPCHEPGAKRSAGSRQPMDKPSLQSPSLRPSGLPG